MRRRENMDQKQIARARRGAASLGWKIEKVRGEAIYVIDGNHRLIGGNMTAEEVIEMCEEIEHVVCLRQSD